MLEQMFNAQVGDDVFGEDPSVNALEAKAAAMFGMEAALFCPSGTMTNQIAIKCHTQPGDEVICEELSHVYIYEGGGIAFNSGSQVKPIKGERGRITAQQIEPHINPPFDYKARTSLVCLENTTNRGGGSCYDVEEIKKIKKLCGDHHLKLHLDGARIFNALVAQNESAKTYGEIFDSISVCLSKGLGTPVGSLLLGSSAFIAKARRVRKVMGGGMRQAGYLAAAGIYALDNHIERLAMDHEHAIQIGNALNKKSFVKEVYPVDTNIVIAEFIDEYPSQQFADVLTKEEIMTLAISPSQIRMITHLDVNHEMVEKVITTIEQIN